MKSNLIKNKAIKFFEVASFIMICSLITLGCKKESSTPVTLKPVSNPQAHVNKMTAKVNNNNWVLGTQLGYLATITSCAMNKYYCFAGMNSFSSPYTTISLYFRDTTGVINLKNSTDFSATYQDENYVQYSCRGGTINISSMDTVGSKGSIFTKLNATFSFNTDTINGKSFQITNGVIDYQNK